MMHAIPPIWDDNETWLGVAGVVLWGPFPVVCARLPSAFYVPLPLMPPRSILRRVAFDFRHKSDRSLDLGRRFCRRLARRRVHAPHERRRPGSGVHHARDNFDAIEQTDEVKEARAGTFELLEFLHGIVRPEMFPWARFPHRAGLHSRCGTLRRLRIPSASEQHEPFFSMPMNLLSKVRDIQFVMRARPDECRGFGGTFSVFEEAVSGKMGYDKVSDHAQRHPRISWSAAFIPYGCLSRRTADGGRHWGGSQ